MESKETLQKLAVRTSEFYPNKWGK